MNDDREFLLALMTKYRELLEPTPGWLPQSYEFDKVRSLINSTAEKIQEKPCEP